jgi:hypothetical protein
MEKDIQKQKGFLIHIDEKLLAQKMAETKEVQKLLNKILNEDD